MMSHILHFIFLSPPPFKKIIYKNVKNIFSLVAIQKQKQAKGWTWLMEHSFPDC